MTKSKSTKRALISSFLALIFCCAMFLGTTFAWFTDSATTGVNTIKSGTLDVQLLDTEGNSIEGQTLEFKKADGAPADEAVLWEPGCTYELPGVVIKNNGNLALKYKISVSGVTGDAKLLEAIDFTYDGLDINAEGHLKAGESSDTLVIKGQMKKTAGNEYQNLTISGIAITVVATQDTVEYDSNDNQYDAQAEYPVLVSSAQELKDVISDTDTTSANVELAEGNYTTNFSVPAGKDIVISGAGSNPEDTVLDGQIAALSNGTLILKNLTINVDDTINDYTGISQTGSSGIAIWGNQDVICENVVFNMSLADSTAITSWWSTNDGANITVKNCTFNCNGQRPIRSDASVTVEGCTFNDPYRYAVQMTSKASTITAEGNAVVNFKNNTINAGNTSSKPVYGVQLEGSDYGCSNLTINGSGNTINLGSTGKTGTMYVYEGTTLIHDITWNVTDGTPVNIG